MITLKTKQELKSEYDKEYRAKNLDKIKEKKRQYYLANREKFIAKNKRWRELNPDRRKKWRDRERAYCREYYAKHIEERRERIKNYFRDNPEVRRINEQKRRARRRNARGEFSRQDWDKIKKQFENTCPACSRREPEIKLTIDHIIPLCQGGKHHKDNIQPLCRSCNCRKRTRTRKWNPDGQMHLIIS